PQAAGGAAGGVSSPLAGTMYGELLAEVIDLPGEAALHGAVAQGAGAADENRVWRGGYSENDWYLASSNPGTKPATLLSQETPRSPRRCSAYGPEHPSALITAPTVSPAESATKPDL